MTHKGGASSDGGEDVEMELGWLKQLEQAQKMQSY